MPKWEFIFPRTLKVILKRAKDKKYISGIYNYCDRWCERCQFTSKCLNCTLVEEQFGDLEEYDVLNEIFWQRFSEMIHNTLVMVKEMAEERGIDLDTIDLENNGDNENTFKEDDPVKSPNLDGFVKCSRSRHANPEE